LQVIGYQSWSVGQTRLSAGAIFPGLDENAHETSGQCTSNVGFRIIANHYDVFGEPLQTLDGRAGLAHQIRIFWKATTRTERPDHVARNAPPTHKSQESPILARNSLRTAAMASPKLNMFS